MSTRPRVCGSDHDDPGPQPGRTYAELIGGPLDGQLLDVTGSPETDLADGAALLTEAGLYGPGGRALHGPGPAALYRWHWEGDVP
ncbi:hypothetical protein [Streptomyces sp. NPDC058495]|uniref:hypothetical protein n=1 Tax=unclassified Streptomyces TaxID=2593676 RepID=UPI0036535171